MEKNRLTTAWIFGPVICKLIPYLQGVSVGASVYTLVVVAVERCYSICFPWKQRLSPSSCRKIIVLIWIAAGVITLPWTVVFQLHQAGQYKVPIQFRFHWQYSQRINEQLKECLFSTTTTG